MEENPTLNHDEAIGIAHILLAAVAAIEDRGPIHPLLIDAMRDWAIELIDRSHGAGTPEEGEDGSE